MSYGDPERRNGQVSHETEPRRRSFSFLLIFAACAAFAVAGLIALGNWQIQRLQWKRTLIHRVEERVHAAPVPAPGPERWVDVSAESDEYRHVQLTGTFLYPLTTKVQAVTDLGSGYWLLTPLRVADGNVVLINRGFVPAGPLQQESNGAGRTVTVTGLLRMPEPGGGFLRRNDAAAGRWYSRDIRAIAAAHGLPRVAPYFVDADASTSAASSEKGAANRPIGGLTVVSFHNNHLGYALTWYALALLVAGAAVWVVREERKRLRNANSSLRVEGERKDDKQD